MENNIGQKLLLASGNATKEVVLIAPFVKTEALRRITSRIPASASLKVFARWIPGEILAGVCDLEIYDLIHSRKNSELFVHPLLHAKSFRFDDLVYIGSANLTSKALGWAYPSNLEILESASDHSLCVRDLESQLLETSIKVDSAYRDEMARLVQSISDLPPIDDSYFKAHIPTDTLPWLPRCRDPWRLWLVYSNALEAQKRTVESAYTAALEDLSSLAIPEGLSRNEFQTFVAAALELLPAVTEVAIRAMEGVTEAEAVDLITPFCNAASDYLNPTEQWEILREWLLEFFPTTYRVETHPEVFRIGRVVGQ